MREVIIDSFKLYAKSWLKYSSVQTSSFQVLLRFFHSNFSIFTPNGFDSNKFQTFQEIDYSNISKTSHTIDELLNAILYEQISDDKLANLATYFMILDLICDVEIKSQQIPPFGVRVSQVGIQVHNPGDDSIDCEVQGIGDEGIGNEIMSDEEANISEDEGIAHKLAQQSPSHNKILEAPRMEKQSVLNQSRWQQDSFGSASFLIMQEVGADYIRQYNEIRQSEFFKKIRSEYCIVNEDHKKYILKSGYTLEGIVKDLMTMEKDKESVWTLKMFISHYVQKLKEILRLTRETKVTDLEEHRYVVATNDLIHSHSQDYNTWETFRTSFKNSTNLSSHVKSQ